MISINRMCFRLALLLLLFPLVTVFAQKPAKSPADVKAGFLLSFTKAVAWPDEDKMTVFKICVLNAQDIYPNLVRQAAESKFQIGRAHV